MRYQLNRRNEFSYTGDNAMSSFGSTGRCLYQNCSVKLNYNSGVDGRPGNQPRYTHIVGNLVREVGMWQKQSGAWSQVRLLLGIMQLTLLAY